MDYAVDATIVAAVIALVSVAKSMGFPTKFAPLLALVVGVGFVLGRNGQPITFDNVFLGVLSGLAASGAYSGTKAVATR